MQSDPVSTCLQKDCHQTAANHPEHCQWLARPFEANDAQSCQPKQDQRQRLRLWNTAIANVPRIVRCRDKEVVKCSITTYQLVDTQGHVAVGCAGRVERRDVFRPIKSIPKRTCGTGYVNRTEKYPTTQTYSTARIVIQRQTEYWRQAADRNKRAAESAQVYARNFELKIEESVGANIERQREQIILCA